MKRRFSLFTYPVMDMKAAEAELNRRAAKGWPSGTVTQRRSSRYAPIRGAEHLLHDGPGL